MIGNVYRVTVTGLEKFQANWGARGTWIFYVKAANIISATKKATKYAKGGIYPVRRVVVVSVEFLDGEIVV